MNYTIKESGKIGSIAKLSTTFPKKVFDDPNKTLKDCGISKNETLLVEIK